MAKKTSISIGLVVNELLKPLGTKIYPIIANADTTLPFVVYQRSGTEVYDDKDGYIEEIATIGVVIAANSYAESVQLAEKARELLIKTGEVLGVSITDAEIVDAEENRTDDIYTQKMTIKYWIE